MSRFRLSRRALLRGSGSVALALPFLEIMQGRGTAHAAGATAPLRYLITFAGLALATDHTTSPYILPTALGPDYLSNLKASPAGATSPNVHALAPLVERSLGGDVTFVSNLHLPRATGPANWNTAWHPPTMRPLLCGKSSTPDIVAVDSPTSDTLAAWLLGGGTAFPHLALRAQPQKYRFSEPKPEVGIAGGRLSADKNGPIEPFVDPGQVYDQLFGAAPKNPADGDLSNREERAVVDLVLERANSLRARLGNADQKRLDQHLAELREFERRLMALGSTPTCSPGAKPTATFPADLTEKSGWSNETLRAQLMNDLVYLAFKCDLSRAGSLMYTYASSYTAVSDILGRKVTGDMHELTHSAGDADTGSDLAKVWQWHIGNFAYLLDKLKGTLDVDGTSLLHNSMIVFVHEAGFGTEPGATEALNDNFGAHSGNNMIAMLAGAAGGNFKPRGHVNAGKSHPASALVSAMRAVGVQGPLGEINDGLAQLG